MHKIDILGRTKSSWQEILYHIVIQGLSWAAAFVFLSHQNLKSRTLEAPVGPKGAHYFQKAHKNITRAANMSDNFLQ